MPYPILRSKGKNGRSRSEVLPEMPLPATKQKGILVVSLDFELYWGVRDIATINRCQEKLLAARAAIPALLELFVEYGIHATWATVGMLFCQSKTEVVRSMPARSPRYARAELSAEREIAVLGMDEDSDPYHFASSLINKIAATPNQEVGTHTFSHFYCLEDGQDADAFRADLEAALSSARKSGFEMESLVFPRNQVNPDYLSICAELGIKVYRGTNAGWIYAPRKQQAESLIRRGVRLIDCYANLSGHNTYDPQDICGSPINLPSSRYLWMYSPFLRPFEALRARRIQHEMMYAARRGRVYHLWFHPEDLGVNIERKMAFLRTVFGFFAQARDRGEIESLNMREVARKFAAERAGVNVYAVCPPSAGGSE